MYSKRHAIKLAKEFIVMLENGKIKISRAFLFGNCAKGNSHEYSDIDLAISSPDFSGFRFEDLGKIAKFKLKASADIEVHPFKDSDFNQGNPFVKEIITTGLKIA
jgi:predicted nucleotidyltransferase